MKKILLLSVISLLFYSAFSQPTLNLTGGVNLTKGTINADVLTQVIQQKQEEVFTRLFTNIIVKYFQNNNPTSGVYNFPTYYCMYGLLSDLTIGKSKTTVSKAVLNSASELAYIYSFARFVQDEQIYNQLVQNGASLTNELKKSEFYKKFDSVRNEKHKIVSSVKDGTIKKDNNKLRTLNYYLEAAFEVLSKSDSIQQKFSFKRPITSSEIGEWYQSLGMINDTIHRINDTLYKDLKFKDYLGNDITLSTLIDTMKNYVKPFLGIDKNNWHTDESVKTVSNLKKDAIGFDSLSSASVNAIKLILLDYANQSDYLFDLNLVKSIVNLLVENIQFGVDESSKINQVYVDVESLILSLDKEFVTKNKRSSISSAAWLVNPRLFFTIGTSNAFFLNNTNQLDKTNGTPTALRNVNLASEKIGFRIKVYDPGYTHSFGPGEVYRWHGYNYVWTAPQKKPLISSVYYDIYASGLLYNVLDLKTNQNFDFGYLASNVGIIFFNGLEFSTGIGVVYKDGLNAKNSFIKVDFDIPIIDYLTALKNKKSN